MAHAVRNRTSRVLVLNLLGGNSLRLPPKAARKEVMILDEECKSPDIINCQRQGHISLQEVKQHEKPASSFKTATKKKPVKSKPLLGSD